jgi:hypothetical protein
LSSIWSTKMWHSNLCFSLFLPAWKKEDVEFNCVSSCSIALGSPLNECILSQHVIPEQRSFLFPFWDGTRCSDIRHGELNSSREKSKWSSRTFKNIGSHSALASEDLCGRALGWIMHPIEKTFPIIVT